VSNERLGRIRGFLLDMDGTLYIGGEAVPGAVAFMATLARSRRPHLVLTNNSSAARSRYRERLGRLGMPVPLSAVLTSGGASAEWLAASTSLRRPFVLGTRALTNECRRAGLAPANAAPETADCVLLGYDTGVTYASLTEACLLVASGLPYYATHADRTCISPRGLLPDAGALIAAIEVTTGRTPIVLGKPEASMVEAGLRRLGTSVDETLILGDQLDTDMMLGQRSGMFSVLTLTGEAARRGREYENVRPDLTVAHPGELLERLRAAGALP
jgi:HAD superfamily hydrolase (TIGR01450 family)